MGWENLGSIQIYRNKVAVLVKGTFEVFLTLRLIACLH